ncbi:hypothetical protein VE00_09004 [Pseudogymnoascus sp. WSF 3629]|nr:hypothetical protein VE00_09004 [Pseudogymnoascus sp. WSF 3629]
MGTISKAPLEAATEHIQIYIMMLYTMVMLKLLSFKAATLHVLFTQAQLKRSGTM